MYKLESFNPPKLHSPIVTAASNPLGIVTDIRAENVARVAAQRLHEGPVIRAKDVDTLIKSTAHKECA